MLYARPISDWRLWSKNKKLQKPLDSINTTFNKISSNCHISANHESKNKREKFLYLKKQGSMSQKEIFIR